MSCIGEGDYFQKFLSAFEAYSGNTLGEKTESFLLACGVAPTTIEKIRRLLEK